VVQISDLLRLIPSSGHRNSIVGGRRSSIVGGRRRRIVGGSGGGNGVGRGKSANFGRKLSFQSV